MLRRWRSLKKICYAAVILLLTIVLYASTSNNEYVDDVNDDWKLPVVSDGTLRVDKALLEPLHRLPLGPFEEQPVPVIIETLKLEIPTFNDTKPTPKSGGDNHPAPPAAAAPAAQNKQAAAAPPPPPPQKPPAAIPPKPPAGAAPGAAGAKPQAAAAASPVAKPVPPSGGGASMAGGTPKPLGSVASSSNSNASSLGKPLAGAAGGTGVTQKPKPPAPPPPPPAGKPLPDLTKTTQEMAQRLAFTKTQCDKYKFPHEVDADVYVLPKYNITYCKVPKSGSTYWEQVFSFLSKIPKELEYLQIKSPFQISKYDIRYTSHFTLPRHNWKIETDKDMMMKTKRILFVRHPLERLWSSYIEKFYLIDFWSTLGLQVRTKSTDVKCPKTITFREFIDFTLPIFNEFWAPVTELCNPCTFEPTFIGHIETMREDSLYILKRCNLQWIFTEQEKISRQENHMIDMAIYNYQIHSIQWYSFFHKCFSQKDLATRLWDVFKKVGYLSSHGALPDNLPDYNQTTIIKEIKIQAAKYPLDTKNRRAQQLKIMKRDYEGLPKPIMAKILEKYAMDFELFGYSTQIPTS